MYRSFAACLVPLALLSAPRLNAQDAHFLRPIPEIETRLRADSFLITSARGSRAEGDRTQRVGMEYPDGVTLAAKWAPAGRGASEFNNEPRYEVAAYHLQKLFLPEDEYVVPPTVLRAFPLEYVREIDAHVPATFDGAESVLVALQYWMLSVTPDDVWDDERFEADTVYARHLANLNVLTHLIEHRDSNVGNFLISRDPGNPRIFSVDNGVAFRSVRSDRGDRLRSLRVDRLPHATVERLRAVGAADLDAALGVLYEFEIRDGRLEPRGPGENLDGRRGVRVRDGRVQIGLTDAEIRDVSGRLRRLIERIDDGKLGVF